MNRKDLLVFLVLEILSAILAVLSFTMIEERFNAGMVAGSGFLILGLVIVIRTWSWPSKWVSFVFWAGHIHLWLISLPMMLTRISNREAEFNSLEILGMAGNEFHRFSEKFFIVLLAATLIDLIRVFMQKSVKKTSAE